MVQLTKVEVKAMKNKEKGRFTNFFILYISDSEVTHYFSYVMYYLVTTESKGLVLKVWTL